MTPVPTFRELAEELQRCMAMNDPVKYDCARANYDDRLDPATMLKVYEALEAAKARVEFYASCFEHTDRASYEKTLEGEITYKVIDTASKSLRLLDGVTDEGET